MAFQDDAREEEQRILFELIKKEEEGRGGIDAVMILEEEVEIPFELKTTNNGSVTTVRDFGYDHIKKWKDKHWLISKYTNEGDIEYSLYGSPQAMSTWIDEKEKYIKPDFELAEIAPNLITLENLYQIVGEKEFYTLEDARKLNKKQYTIEKYHEQMDDLRGYSPNRMLDILKYRTKYLIERGSTLNNPHIPTSYFDGWEKITINHSVRLRELVIQSMST